MQTNLGRWSNWYARAAQQIPYGDPTTYSMAEEWLRGLYVEDWGCGYGWFRNVHVGGYRGIDGTHSLWCDAVEDLTTYRSNVSGILLRHVLEHNHEWEKILDNAVASFVDKICIILFTPLTKETVVIDDDVCGMGVPDIAFNINDILERLDCSASVVTIDAESIYGQETVIRAHR